ncbi:hypothetical protein OIU84_019273 [Salix udensis]|uniref:Uncharacterized protein n=1 Tax=Salix udensis TaxID=889485 RepID=A0AAD6KYE3_9ROSI|nr:hypothetical protein OIU84_019273 [Salix udensis]
MEYKDRGSSIKMTFCQPDPIQLDAKCQNPVGFSACYTRKVCSLLMTRHRIKGDAQRSIVGLVEVSLGGQIILPPPSKENDFDDDNADSKNKQGDCRKGAMREVLRQVPSKYATGKYSSKAKHQKQLKERDGSARIRVEKDVSVLSAASYVQSRTKGMHPDTVYDCGRREALLILRIKENGSIRLAPTKTLIISTCNGSRTEIFSFSSPEHKNLNLPPVYLAIRYCKILGIATTEIEVQVLRATEQRALGKSTSTEQYFIKKKFNPFPTTV